MFMCLSKPFFTSFSLQLLAILLFLDSHISLFKQFFFFAIELGFIENLRTFPIIYFQYLNLPNCLTLILILMHCYHCSCLLALYKSVQNTINVIFKTYYFHLLNPSMSGINHSAQFTTHHSYFVLFNIFIPIIK